MIQYEVFNRRRCYQFTATNYKEAREEIRALPGGFIVRVENGVRTRL